MWASSVKIPSRPVTGTGGSRRGLASTHAQCPLAGYMAAPSSASVPGRQSITSTMPIATPIGPPGASLPHGRAAARIASGPRCSVRRDRSSTVLAPMTMRPAHG